LDFGSNIVQQLSLIWYSIEGKIKKMKQILLSAGSIIFIAGLSISATGAFFSDQKTSNGNTFTAGSLVLAVDSMSHYDGLICVAIPETASHHWAQDPNSPTTQRPDLIDQPCDGTWTLTTLGPTNKFFNFSDIKPGDNGENTISLHVSNDAWLCGTVTATNNSELAKNTYVFGWVDNASTSGAVPGDNKWQAGERVLFQPRALSSLQSGVTLRVADAAHGPALVASTTNYIGLEWCTGTMDVSVPGSMKCDGSNLGNNVQNDSATADITFYALQARNNPGFNCVLEINVQN
jgi:predicted ribosomally synthesized peptide with SipW-like signal peptide